MSSLNRGVSSDILLAVVIVPYMMSFSHLCLCFPLLLFPVIIPCIIVFSKPLCRMTRHKDLLPYNIIQPVNNIWNKFNIEELVQWAIQNAPNRNVTKRLPDCLRCGHWSDRRQYWPGQCCPLWGWPAALWRWTTEILTWSMPSSMRMTGRVVTLDSRSTDLVNAIHYEDDRPRCNAGQQKYWPGQCRPIWGWPAALWRWTTEILTW